MYPAFKLSPEEEGGDLFSRLCVTRILDNIPLMIGDGVTSFQDPKRVEQTDRIGNHVHPMMGLSNPVFRLSVSQIYLFIDSLILSGKKGGSKEF